MLLIYGCNRSEYEKRTRPRVTEVRAYAQHLR
jgi:hypothetical protein